jgi:hypothetical protein
MERLFSEYCSGDGFRHDKLMMERFKDYEDEIIGQLDSQATVSSADDAPHLTHVSANEPVTAHSQPALTMVDEDCLPQPLGSPELDLRVGAEVQEVQVGDSWVCESFGEEMAGLVEVDPMSLQDSQDSTVSILALETRKQAFRAIRENAKGRAGGVIGLLSTTDNHYTPEKELHYEGPLR